MLIPSRLWFRQVPQLQRRRELHSWLPLPWLPSQLCRSECPAHHAVYLPTDHLHHQEPICSELKGLADECNTNLYVCNLPKNMSEHEFSNLFAPYKVNSSRILRDRYGHSRGVGFARYVIAFTYLWFVNHTESASL